MNQRLQTLLLVGVIATVGYGAMQRPQSVTSITHPAPRPVEEPLGGSVTEEEDALLRAEAAIAGNDAAMLSLEERRRARLERDRRGAAESQRLEAMREQGRRRIDSARREASAAFNAKIAAMEQENAELIEKAMKQEAVAIRESHATVARRNREQWNAWSDFLAETVIIPNPPSPT